MKFIKNLLKTSILQDKTVAGFYITNYHTTTCQKKIAVIYYTGNLDDISAVDAQI